MLFYSIILYTTNSREMYFQVTNCKLDMICYPCHPDTFSYPSINYNLLFRTLKEDLSESPKANE